eukprot:3769133-Alexandrium_andersonii.AAC.1
MPSTSRQTVLGRAALAWHSVNHTSVSHGFVAAGIANALDGTEDDQLSAEVRDFWTELEMPRRREELRAQIQQE